MNKVVAGMSGGITDAPDIETSSDNYASRFCGEVGQYLLGVQERGLFALMGQPSGSSVIDVGGGHAQLAPPMARAGYVVTVAGSDASCGLRLAQEQTDAPIDFVACDLKAMPFADGQFNVVTSVRLMAHIDDWQLLVSELCRVAGEAVIIDFPIYFSLNALSLLAFPLKKHIEKNTRTYRTFFGREVRKAFAEHGFRQTRSWRQFVLPMALHRAGRGSTLLQRVEELMRKAGLTRIFGNPVLVRFDRESSQQENA
ncbi:class I SAM-dependent methyltransferase [Novosphingobium pentaromativorans]|nr:class I SAM-dependent methyltransferase [Novosphingobium pentaromativorans]AIT80929.1 methyltransferase [Novosphingobium pentaromativorans US6-1]